MVTEVAPAITTRGRVTEAPPTSLDLDPAAADMAIEVDPTIPTPGLAMAVGRLTTFPDRACGWEKTILVPAMTSMDLAASITAPAMTFLVLAATISALVMTPSDLPTTIQDLATTSQDMEITSARGSNLPLLPVGPGLRLASGALYLLTLPDSLLDLLSRPVVWDPPLMPAVQGLHLATEVTAIRPKALAL